MNTRSESSGPEHGTASERIGLCCRRDTKWTRTVERGETRFVASHPLKSDHFSCSEADYHILQLVAPDKTYSEVCEQFNHRFRPATLQPIELKRLLFHGLQSGVLRSAQSSDRETLSLDQTRTAPSSRMVRLASSIVHLVQYQLSFGTPGGMLDFFAKPLTVFFASAFIPFALLLFAFAGLSVAYRWDEFWIALPTWNELRSPSALIGYGLIFFVTRAIHELGHATACKRFGLECRDFGLLMSFGMICPYVDISEGWKSKSRMQRLTTAFGGIYFELLIASMAALVWSFTTSSFTNDLCYQTLLVCSVTTILFNANPLMKYDGYYMLSDALGINNLREKSWQAFDRLSGGRLDSTIGKQLGLSLYFLGSLINRAILIVTLGWFVLRFASDWQLTGVAIGVFFAYGLCALLLWIATWTQRTKANGKQIPLRAQTIGWTGTVCVLLWAMTLPLPKRTWGIGTLKPGDTISLYTSEPGVIVQRFPADGEMISAGDSVVILGNQDLWKEKLKLQATLQQATIKRKSMDAAAYHNTHLLDEKTIAESRIRALKIQVDEVDQRLESLNIKATQSGYFLSNPISHESETGLLHQASFTTNKKRSRPASLSPGVFFPKGSLIGAVVTNEDPHLECEISKDQVDSLSIGTQVAIRLTTHPHMLLKGFVSKVSSAIMPDGNSTSNSIVSQHAIGRILVRIDCEELNHLDHIHGHAELMFHHFDQSMADYLLEAMLRNIRWR